MYIGSTANKVWWASLMLCLGLMMSATPAMAQTSTEGLAQLDDESRQAFNKHLGDAQRAFSGKRHEDAIASLKRAYAIYPHPRIFYKLGQAHEELGADLMAKEAYETYLASDEETDVAEVEARIARLDARLSRPSLLTLRTTPPGARVYIDGQREPVGTTPLYHDLPPGKHTLSIKLEDHDSRTIELTADAGNVLDLDAELVPSNLSIQEPFQDLEQARWLPGARTTGLTSLATGTAGGVAFLLARQRGRLIDDALAQRTTTSRPDELARTQRQHNRLVTAGWALMGVSAVAGSVSLFTWNQERARLSAELGPARQALSLEVSF